MKLRGRILKIIVTCLLAVAVFGLIKATALSDTAIKNPKHNVCPYKSSATGNDESAYSYVYFGSYPQKEIKNDSKVYRNVVAMLSEKQKSEFKNDVWFENNKYRIIYDSEKETRKVYKWVRIKWRVLNYDSDNYELMLVSDSALEVAKYNEGTAANITYDYSTVRSFLNGLGKDENHPGGANVGYSYKIGEPGLDEEQIYDSFIDTAFSSTEKAALISGTVDNTESNGNYNEGAQTGENTDDYVFLLSYKDVMSESFGFCKYESKESETRKFEPSDYCKGNKNYPKDNPGVWLRSSYSDNKNAMYLKGGKLRNNQPVGSWGLLAPAIKISIEDMSVIEVVTEDNEDDTSSGSGGDDSGSITYSGLSGAPNNPLNPDRYIVGYPITLYEPEREGYIFAGWYKDQSFFDAVQSLNETEPKAITLYARWQMEGQVANPIHVHTGAPLTGGSNNLCSDRTVFNYLYFGSYPQTEVTLSAEKNAIDDQLEREGKLVGDVWIGENKYRKVVTEPEEEVMFPKDEYKYYKWERIRWRILDVDTANNRIFIAADMALDCVPFNESDRAINWGNSTIRSYLNGYNASQNADKIDYSKNKEDSFISTAFSLFEQSVIITADVKNNEHKNYTTEAGPDTKDRIFLLSYREITSSLFGYCREPGCCSLSRQYGATDYAVERGVLLNSTDNVVKYTGGKETISWWTRSPGNTQSSAQIGNFVGIADRNAVKDRNLGVVPAMYITLNGNSLYSNTDDHTSGIGARDELYKINYILNGGTNSAYNPANYAYKLGVKNLYAPTRYSYRFDGWFKDAGFTEKITSISNTERADVTVYAKWTYVEPPKPPVKPTYTASLSKTDYAYTGKAIKPKVVISGSDGSKIASNGYKVSYSKNKEIGVAKLTVTYLGAYAYNAPNTLNFNIVPKAIQISKLSSPQAKKMLVTWKAPKSKKDLSNVTGYEIQYSTDKKFGRKGTKKITISKNKTSETTLKNLSKNKKYFVRLRVYKQVKDGKKKVKLYSAWSKVKNLKMPK